MMRNLLIITCSSSSIVASAHSHHHHYHHHNFLSHKQQQQQSQFMSHHNITSKPQPTSLNPPSSSSSTHSYPLKFDSLAKTDYKYYAEMGSKLVEDGRFEDFGMVVESVLSSCVNNECLDFGNLLNLKLVVSGIIRGLSEGRIKDVIALLGYLSQLHVDVLGMFDGSDMELLKVECFRIVSNGNLLEAVQLMETLAGFNFLIKELIKPSDFIRVSVNRRSPSLAVRYASLLPHAEILYCTIVKEFGKRSDLVSAVEAFEASKQKLSGHNMYVYRTVIDVCGLCGDCYKSRLIYEDLLAEKVTPNIYVFNSLMNVNAHDLTYTMEVYKQMQDLGVQADMTSYNILLKACCLAGRVDLAQDIYREVQHLETTGALKIDVFTYSTIIKVFADAKLWQMAIRIKEDMLSAGVIPNAVTWSSLISACANAGLVDQAIQLFEEMLIAGFPPNSQCFNTILHACVEGCQYDRAFRLFYTWKSSGSPENSIEDPRDNEDDTSSVLCTDGNSNSNKLHIVAASRPLTIAKSVPFSPTITTYNILMKACGTDFYRAKALMDEMRLLGLSPNHISFSILIDICGEAGNVEGALQLLKTMIDIGITPDVIAYTTAIKICVENNKLNMAFSLFSEMKKHRIKPNLVTYNTLLRARNTYGSLQEVQQCLAIYQDMRKAGHKPNDYYLKLLLEEWCEGTIQEDNLLRQSASHNKADIGETRSILLERVADNLRKNKTKSLAVDIQGLTKVEARLLVLAVLRMIRENYKSGYSIRDDLVVIIGVIKVGAECAVKDAITKLLETELGLEVITEKPGLVNRTLDNKDKDASNLVPNSRVVRMSELHRSLNRRPATLQRLVVTRKSLNQWLRRR